MFAPIGAPERELMFAPHLDAKHIYKFMFAPIGATRESYKFMFAPIGVTEGATSLRLPHLGP